MFRLAPLLSAAAALSDETSLMQGLKPQQVTPQKEDKSKAISNLLQSATNMLKNGATPDVTDFAEATLTEITGIVLPAITNASATDQALVDSTFTMFATALQELSDGNNRVLAANNQERALSRAHKACRAEEEEKCQEKIQCDYDLWHIWRRFVEEESELRQLSLEVERHFCAEDANGTMWIFRDHAVTLFPPWLEQKPIVEHWEEEYDEKVPHCERKFEILDDKTAECDAYQLQLEEAACSHGNTVAEVRNLFAQAWAHAIWTYQRVVDEVHCLEIDRWKEWRTLSTVQCLLTKTRDRNGRPCDETTDEITTEVTECEEVQMFESIDHLRIDYHEVPEYPESCATPPWEVIPAVYPWPGVCVPVPPHIPCSGEYIAQEYAALWIPPQPEFHSENSHCNQRPECQRCELEPELPVCFSIFGHTGPWMVYPAPEDECHAATRAQMLEGVFDSYGDGHFDYYAPEWTLVQGGATSDYSDVNVGAASFNEMFAACPVVRYTNPSMTGSPAVYKRHASAGAYPGDAHALFTYLWAKADNAFHTDFDIYPSLEDARAGTNPWQFCNFSDEPQPNHFNVGFPRDCGPAVYQPHIWFHATSASGSQTQGYFEIYTGANCPH